MTRALVVYESMFGNTKVIADAVARGLVGWDRVDVVEVSAAPDALPPDVGLLIIGAPTHAFSLSRESTRKSAAGQATGPLVSPGRGAREWLGVLEPATTAVRTCAFDTKVRSPRLPGSAARGIAKRLRRKGLTVCARPISFYVNGTTGPLLDGEVERAEGWSRRLTPAQVAGR